MQPELEAQLTEYAEKWREWRESPSDIEPSAESFLGDLQTLLQNVSDEERGEFFSELIYEDFFHLSDSGRFADLQMYRDRFPEWASLVQRVAERVASSLDSTADGLAEPTPSLPAIDGFDVQERIGDGSFGVVYLGVEKELNRPVAIKILRTDRDTPAHLTSLLKEAQDQARLAGVTGIVPIYSYPTTNDGRECIVSMYVDGIDLKTWLERVNSGNDEISHRDAVHIVAQIAETLHGAHKSGLFHRDVKPSNILVDSDRKAWLTDFGLALRDEDFSPARELRVGTPQYMSPEQAGGNSASIDNRADIYSLGIVLIELLTGQLPYRSRNAAELLEELKTTQTRPPRQLDDRVPPELDRICKKAVALEPKNRYSTAIEFAEDLREWLRKTTSQNVIAESREAFGKVLPSSSSAFVPPEADSETGVVEAAAIVPYLAEQCRAGRLAILLGADASSSAALPLRSQVLDWLKSVLRKRGNPGFDDFAQLASMYVEKEQTTGDHDPVRAKKSLVDRIRREYLTLETNRNSSDFGEIYPRVAKLPVADLFNANWDDLLERCMVGLGMEFESFDNQHLVPPHCSGWERRVVYLYGRINGPQDDFIVTSDDLYYMDHRKGNNAYGHLKACLGAGTTLLVVGMPFADVTVAEYLRGALKDASPESRIYAVFPDLSEHDAHKLRIQHKVLPIVHVDKCDERALPEFLDDLLEALRVPEKEPSLTEVSSSISAVDSNAEEAVRHAEERLAVEGFQSPAQCFANFTAELPAPRPAPTHPLLHSVYIERGLTDWIENKLRKNEKAGITGLLGIGGIGKTYMAMKIAGDMSEQGWEVVWVSLLQQGTDDALNQMATAYQLEFSTDLHTEEKVVALRWMFTELTRIGRKPLVILDNAERFPDLTVLLQALVGLPVLVTSRTEECRDLVEYQRLEPMTTRQAMQLCELILNNHDAGRFSRLHEQDHEDLEAMCTYLGGHPLGIRLVIKGFLNLPEIRRNEPRPFSRITEAIRAEGLKAFPEVDDPDTGLAGQVNHKTLFSTFEWLYRELPSISPDNGRSAQLLLPIVAVVGALPVEKQVLATAAEMLRDNLRGWDLAKRTPDTGTYFPGLQEFGTTVSEQEAGEGTDIADVSHNPIHMMAAWGTEPSDTDTQSKRAADLAEVVAHWIERAEREPAENRREDLVRFHLSNWIGSNEQSEKKVAWVNLLIERIDDALQAYRNVISQLHWLEPLFALAEDDKLDNAIDLLNQVALLEAAEVGEAVSIHPLVREFAFEERSRDQSVHFGPQTSEYLMQRSISLSGLHLCGLAVLSEKPEYADSFIDLLPRLKRNRALADSACDYILKRFSMYQHRDWQKLTEMYEAGVELATSVGLSDKHGRLLSDLGEIRDRMGYSDGFETLEKAVRVLSDTMDPASYRSRVWSEMAVQRDLQVKEVGQQNTLAARRLRETLSDIWLDRSSATFAQQLLRDHASYSPSRYQLALAVTYARDSNSISHSVESLFDLCGTTTSPLEMQRRAATSWNSILQRAWEPQAKQDFVHPERLTERNVTFTCLKHQWGSLSDSQFDHELGTVLRESEIAGFRPSRFLVDVLRHRVKMAIERRKCQTALEHCERWGQIAADMAPRQAENMRLEPSLFKLLATLAHTGRSEADAAELQRQTARIEEQCDHWGRNDLLGWLMLAKALLFARFDGEDRRNATKFAVMAREAFRRYSPGITTAGEVLFRRVVELVDEEEPVFERHREALANENIDVPNFQACLPDCRFPLPKRVISKCDGRRMRLVRGGLQSCLDGKEAWLYPFYVDEETVTVSDFRQFLEESKTVCEIGGQDDAPVAVADPNVAVGFARWAGKTLPNVHEWYAAKWQLAFQNEPEIWERWDQALEELLKRIETAIDGKPLNPHEALPAAKSDIESHQRDALRYYWDRKWIEESPLLSEAIRAFIVRPLLDHEASFDEPLANRFAYGLAASISLTWDEKDRIVSAIPKLSQFQVEELVRILEEERKKFLELDEAHFNQLLKLGWAHKTEFTTLLLNSRNRTREPIEAEDVFTSPPKSPDEPPLSSKADQPQSPIAFSAGKDELVGVWSCTKQGPHEDLELVLVGDPFKKEEWRDGGMMYRHNFIRNTDIGIRCVLPIFTRDDLGLVDPVD